MLKPLFLLLLGAAAIAPQCAAAQKAVPVVYMQIFYEGPAWLAGRRVLSYSPSFRGKTQELVQEADSTRQLSPLALMMPGKESTGTTTYSTVYSTATTDKGTFITDASGKAHLETPAERKQNQQREAAQFNRGLRMLETRADLGKAVLTKALNEAAADGWEVVQLTATGTSGALVYLLRHR